MVEEPDGTLWIATDTRACSGPAGPPDPSRPPRRRTVIKTFHEDEHFAAGHGWVFVEQTPLGVRFATERGPALYDRSIDRILLDSALIAAGGKFPCSKPSLAVSSGDSFGR